MDHCCSSGGGCWPQPSWHYAGPGHASAGKKHVISGQLLTAQCDGDRLPDVLDLPDIGEATVLTGASASPAAVGPSRVSGRRDAARADWHDGAAESHPLRLGEPALDTGDPAHLA